MNVCMGRQMNGWLDGLAMGMWKEGQRDGHLGGWLDRQMYEQMENRWTYTSMTGPSLGWVGGRMDGWVRERWLDGWMCVSMNRHGGRRADMRIGRLMNR